MRRGPRSLVVPKEGDEDFEDDSQIKCVCGFEEDDGFTIQCEVCLVWQHASCVGIGKTNIPEKYYCESCAPPSFSLHKQRTNTVEGFTKIDAIETKDKEASAFISGLGHSLHLTKSDSISIYCPRSFESLKIALKSTNEGGKSPKFSSQFYLKPLKARGYQRRGAIPKYGLFAKSHFEPGTFLCSFFGELVSKSAFQSMDSVSCLQTFVLFIQNTPLAVDARKRGNTARFIRRSCRPNVQIELAIDPEDLSKFDIRLLALNNIYEGDEILLPNDFDFGNNTFKYDCACGNPEFCLSSCLFGSFLFNTDGKKNNQSTSGVSQESDSDAAYVNSTDKRPKKSDSSASDSGESTQTAVQLEANSIVEIKQHQPSVNGSIAHDIVHSSVVLNNSTSVASYVTSKALEMNDEEFVDVEIISDEISPSSNKEDIIKYDDNLETTTPNPLDLPTEPAECTEETSGAAQSKVKVSLSDYMKFRKTAQSTVQMPVNSEYQEHLNATIHSDPISHSTFVEEEIVENFNPSATEQFTNNPEPNDSSWNRSGFTTPKHEDRQGQMEKETGEDVRGDPNYDVQDTSKPYEHSRFLSTIPERTTVPDPYRYSNGNERMRHSREFQGTHSNYRRTGYQRSLSPATQSRYPGPSNEYYPTGHTADHRHYANDYSDKHSAGPPNYEYPLHNSRDRYSYETGSAGSRYHSQSYSHHHHSTNSHHTPYNSYEHSDYRRRPDYQGEHSQHPNNRASGPSTPHYNHANYQGHGHSHYNGQSRYYNGQFQPSQHRNYQY